MAVQYGYNMPMVQTPYGYQAAPMQSYAPAPVVQMAPQPVGGRRGRDSMGRYVSTDMGPNMSGHWQTPPPPPMWSGSYRGYPPDNYWR